MDDLADMVGIEMLDTGLTVFIMTRGLLEETEISAEFNFTSCCVHSESEICGSLLISSLALPASVELLLNLNVSGFASFTG